MGNEFFFKFWFFFSDFPSSGDGFTLGTISEFYAPPLWLFSDSRALVRKRLYLDVFTCVLLQQFQSFQLSFRPPVDSESILGQSEAPVFSFLLAHMEIHFFRTTCWTDWFPRGFFFFFWYLVEDDVAVAVWVDFYSLYSISLVYMFVPVQVLNSFWGEKKRKS